MTWTVIATWKMALDGVCQAADQLQRQAKSAEALTTVIRSVEDDLRFHSVGTSGLPNREGVIQLDGAFMDGDTLSVGVVGAVEQLASPFLLARHCSSLPFNNVLAGKDALRYALAHGFAKHELMTPEAWEQYQLRLREETTGLTSYRGHDTVGVCCLDTWGTMTVGTSTSGLFMKEPGRIGDSPLCGCGFYADSEWGAAAATGVGEDIMKGCLCHDAVLRMRHGQSAAQAAAAAVVELDARLIQKRGHAEAISLICLDRQGQIGVGTNIKFAFVTASDQQPPCGFYCRADTWGLHNPSLDGE